MKRGKRRLLAWLLCLAVALSDASSMGLQVMAKEAVQENSAVVNRSNDAAGIESSTGNEGTAEDISADDGKDGSAETEGSAEAETKPDEEADSSDGEEKPSEGNRDAGDSDSSGSETESGDKANPAEEGGKEQGEDTAQEENTPEETGSEGTEETGEEENNGEAIGGAEEETDEVIGEEDVEEEDAEAAAWEERAVTASGKCGDNLTWTLEDGTLTISGTGEMYDYWMSSNNTGSTQARTTAPWGIYMEEMDTLIINEGVTSIGKSAFYACNNFIGNLSIPNSVKEIGSNAFYNCNGFSGNLIIPNSITKIGGWSFDGCSGFTGDLVIPNSVTEIGDNAFTKCFGFSGKLIISNSLTEICFGTFVDCNGFTGNLVIPDSVIKIGDNAFKNCSSLTGDLVIPDNVVEIGRESFVGCSGFTGNLVIGNNVQNIAPEAFKGCDNFLGNLILGNTLQTIGFSAFENCSGFTGDLLIPDSVTKIEVGAFCGCNGFNGKLIIGNHIQTIEVGVFSDCSNFSGNLTIPDSVTEIEFSAFEGCSGFSGNLTIGNSVQSIGEFAFEYCTGFSGDLIIPDSVSEIGTRAFEGCSGFSGKLILSKNLKKLETETFIFCNGFIGDLSIPDSVTEISESAFLNCSGFNGKLSIGNHVRSIGESAFYGCSSLSGDLIIPDNVIEIGSSAFANCSNFSGNLKISNNITEIEPGTFYNCKNLSGKLQIPDNITIIGGSAFEGCNGFSGDLILPNNVTSIGSLAFRKCSGFNGKLIIPNSIKTIKNATFQYCSGFTNSLIIPDSVTSIENDAFHYCSGFTSSLTISGNVTNIGRWAFGPFDSSQKIFWHCIPDSYGSDCIDGGTVIYDDDVPEPTYLTNSILIKRSDYEASEGDFPSDIQVPSDQAAIGAIDSSTGRLIRSAYITLDGQTYRTDVDGVYYFSLGQSSVAKRYVGASADGYLSASAKSMSVQHGKLTTVSMTKTTSTPTVGGSDVQVQAGKFAVYAADDMGNIIMNATIIIDGDVVESTNGIFYANADSATHYVSASAKGYVTCLPYAAVFTSGGKYGIYLRYNEEYNITYKLGKVTNGDAISQKIWLDSGVYSSSDNFDFTKLASMIGNTAVLKLRDDIAIDAYTVEECMAVSVMLSPGTSSFIYQNGQFPTDTTNVRVKVQYDYRDEFPKDLFTGIQPSTFQLSNIEVSIEDDMTVSTERQRGNFIKLTPNRTLSIGGSYIFDASVKLNTSGKPADPSASYKMTVRAIGGSRSSAGFQTFHVSDADYQKEQKSKRPTTQGSNVSNASVTELLENNILFNLEGTVLESQYFSKEQLQAIEKILTLWIANIDAATDTAREISYEEKFVTDVLKKLKVNIKPYLGVSETTAQIRIKAETKSYGDRTFIFTLNLTNYSWDDQAPFGRFGTVEWRVENTNGIPANYQSGLTSMIAKANTDRFLLQLKELALNSIKEVYSKTWGNKANKVADMIIDKRILDLVNEEFGSVSDMCFKLMIKPTEDTIKGGRKTSKTRCPVDLYVYDSQGNIAGAIINDIAYPMDDGVLVYMEDGAKVVDYFADEYTVKFVGSDTGTMSHEIYEYYSTGEEIRKIDFANIPLGDGKVYQETIPDYFFANPSVYALEEEGAEAIQPDTDTCDEEWSEIILVNGISITPDSLALAIGEEQTLSVIISPETASLKLVSWSSDNEAVVTVSDTGVINGISSGSAKISATSVDGRYTAGCVVTVGTSDPEQGDVLDEDMPQGGIANIPQGLWMSEVLPQIYTGKALKPAVRVYDHKTLLTEKKDYTISYKNNTKANEATAGKNAPTITVTGKGNYTGKETQTFTILPKNITDMDVIADDIVLKISNKIQKPIPVVMWNGKKLAYKKNFALSYTSSNNGAYKECGTYEIIITGTGNYTGSRQILLTITKNKPVSKLSVAKIASQKYTGNEIKPALTVKDGKNVLTENVHYTTTYENNINAGTATVIITGLDDYVGTKRINYKITAIAALTKAKVSLTTVDGLKYSGSVYSGSEIRPDHYILTMTVKGVDKKNMILTLREGVDYTVSYRNNIKTGTATILFSGINGYTGNLKKTYKITPYDIKVNEEQLSQQAKKIKVIFDQSYSYVKGGVKPKPIVIFAGKLLQEKVDYTLSYKNNTRLNDGSNASKLPTVVIKGKGNFKGQITGTYLITPADISKISLIVADKVWQNKPNIYKSKITIKDIDGKALSANRDYNKIISYMYNEDTTLVNGIVRTAGTEISANDIIPAGTEIKVTANAKGSNYYGAISGIYRITKTDINKAAVKIPAQVYTGKAIEPADSIEVKLNGQSLSKENYEIVGYNNNINKGTATVIIRGKNDCGGTKTVKFTITGKGFLWWWKK